MDEVAKLPGLVRRGAVFYYRRRVPLDVRDAFGRAELLVSLHTTDRKAAAEAWFDQSARWDDEFNRLRSIGTAQDLTPEPVLAEEVVGGGIRLYSRTERLQAIRRANRGANAQRPLDGNRALQLARLWFDRENDRATFSPLPDNLDDAIAERSLDVALFTRHLSDPEAIRRTQAVADELLHEHHLSGAPSEAAYEGLCEYLSRAMLELARRDIDRWRREFDKVSYDHLFQGGPQVAPHASPAVFAQAGGITLGEVRKRFQAARIDDEKGLKDRTKDKMRTGLELVVEFFGAETPLTAIDAEGCEEYQRFLRALPPNFTKIRAGRSLRQITETAAARGSPGLMRATRESYFLPLRQMLEWARRKKLIPENPAQGITEGRKAPGDAKRRHSFTPDQLRAMFTAPLYTGCVNDEHGFNTPGPNRPRRGRFWVPLLGLFTGARLGELCQLRVEDVMRSEKGTPFIRIHGEGEGMSVKNENSWRSFPVHPKLERIGFLDFVAEQKAADATHLFPELLVEGRMAGYRASKLFSTFRKAVGVTTPGVCFHSFRHTYIDALRVAGVDREVAERLCGWSNGNRTSSRYGEGPTMDMKLKEVSKAYSDLDLSHLYNLR
ncbi:site-specific integrase [Magnetospirillum sp. 64-120]|uniref:site-specific integrase n=1 Tax=Magnetospirillum sp. 64-120 TaxID=1895778 RepID=UPI00092B5C44|nr:site-specific integrase [Magnetospirillum sp. 64-120]OJX68443.1 MAG: hypothetical protein BGO92_18610 [Magnetospirillum sp. 64-120]